MYIFLAEITPVKPDGTLETVRLSTKNSPSSIVNADGYEWLPVITEHPVFELKLTSNGQLTQAQQSYGSISFHMGELLGNDVWSTYDFSGAFCRLWRGQHTDDFADFVQVFEGKTSSLARETFQGSLTLLGNDTAFATNLLTASYAGTGGAEGPESLKGTLKPWASGPCTNVEPVLVDAEYLIYQVHGYGAIEDIPFVYEMGQALAEPVATVTTYAALAALALEPGQWAKAPAVGMFRLGGQPSKKLTADVMGALDSTAYPNTVSGIIQHLIKVAIPTASFGDMSAFNTTSWCFYTAQQTTIGEVIRKAALDAGGYVRADGVGTWHLGDFYNPHGLEGPTTYQTLTSNQTSEPIVRSFKESVVLGPVWKVRVGHTRVWSVNGDGEVSPIDAGLAAEQAALQAAMEAAQADIEAVQAEMAVNSGRIDAMASDGILDRAEKKYWIDEYAQLNQKIPLVVNQANEFNVTAERDALTAAFTALTSYLTGLSPSWNDGAQDTPVTREDFRDHWFAVYEAIIAVDQAVAAKAAGTAIWGEITGDGKPEDNATVGAPLGTAIGGVPVETVLDQLANAGGTPNELSIALTEALNAPTLDQIRALVMVDRQQLEQNAAQTAANAAQDIANNAIANLNTQYTVQQDTIETMQVDIANASAAITTEATTRASETGALTTTQNSLISRLNNFNGTTGQTVESRITALNQTVVDNNTAQTTSVNTLTSRFNNFNGVTGKTVEATITDTNNTIATNNTAQTTAVNAVKSRIDNVSGSGKTLEATITETKQTIVDNNTAQSANYNTLTSRLNNFNSSGSSVESIYSNLSTTVANNNTAQTTNYNTLTSRLNNFNSSGSSAESIYTALQSTVATNNTTATTNYNSLVSRLNNFGGVSGKTIESKITDVQTTVSDEVSTRASQITSLTSTVNNNNTTLTNSYNTLATRTGVVEAQAVLSLDVNGKVAGIRAANNSWTGSTIDFLADKVRIANSSGSATFPFFVEGGVTYMDAAYIKSLAIGTNKLAINSVTVVHNATLGSGISGTGYGTWYTPVSYTLSAPVDCSLVFILSATQGFPSGDRRWEAHLKCDGSDVNAGGGYKTADTFSLGGQRAVAAGSHTISVDWSGDGGANLSTMNLVILETRR